MQVLLTVFALMPFYLLGAFPTGHLIARAQGIEITKVGSGNVGATNVARMLGKGSGLVTLIGDALKGALAVWLASFISEQLSFRCAAGIAVVTGHCFSIPGRLKGGKGVATGLGVIAALSPATATWCVGAFVIILALGRMVSLASVGAALTAPVYAMLRQEADVLTLSFAAMALLITARHHANLQRIARGKEPRIGETVH